MRIFKALILPNKIEKKRSYLLQHPALFGYVFFILSLIFITNMLVVNMPQVLGYADNISINDLLSYTNTKRSENGVSNLKLNSALSKAAEAKAKHMFDFDYWAHTAPDGTEPWDFILASGYDYLYAGENLAVDFSNSQSVVNAWYQSPTHKENLISDKYTEIGFAVVNGELNGRKTTLVVQMFGYPRVQPQMASAAQSAPTIEPEPVPPPQVIEIQEFDQPNTEASIDLDFEGIESVQDNIALSEPEIENEVIEEDDATLVAAPISDRSELSAGAVLSTTDIFNISRYLAIILGLFLTVIFAIDGYYVKQIGVFRMSGHTLLHIVMLILAIMGIWYTHTGLVL